MVALSPVLSVGVIMAMPVSGGLCYDHTKGAYSIQKIIAYFNLLCSQGANG